MNSYFEQGGFYGGASGPGDQAYRFPLGLSVSPYGQPTRQDTYDASCKLYAAQHAQDHMTPNPFKVDCKEQNGYGKEAMAAAGWNHSAAIRQGCTPDPVSRPVYPDPSTSPRDRNAWNTCGMGATGVPPHHQQPQQNGNQMSQSSTTQFYPWMAIAG